MAVLGLHRWWLCFVLLLGLALSPARGFRVLSPQIIAQSISGEGVIAHFGATTYGYEQARGRLVAIALNESCQSITSTRQLSRSVTSGLLQPMRATRTLEGAIVVLYREDAATETQGSKAAPRCENAQRALWVQKQGAVGLLVPSLFRNDLSTGDELGKPNSGPGLSKLFSAAVTIIVETISSTDAETLRRAVHEYGLVVEASVGESIVDDLSYI